MEEREVGEKDWKGEKSERNGEERTDDRLCEVASLDQKKIIPP